MAVGVDDWLVADSEDEGLFPQPSDPGASGETRSAVVGTRTTSDASVIQRAVFTPGQPCTPPRGRKSSPSSADDSLFTPTGMNSTIDNFTSAPPTSGEPSAVAPKPRPRPRLVMKKPAPSDLNVDATSTFSHISDPPISATRRTSDSIYPATATSDRYSDAVEDVYSFDIAERAKMRSRKSQTAKKSEHPLARMDEVIELTSDEDELALKSTKRQKKHDNRAQKSKAQAKPRVKPTPKLKPVIVLPAGSPPRNAETRDTPTLPAECAPSSQLPASTLPTMPPSTPPLARELTPLSSPLVQTRKRKRIRPLIAEDDDEMIVGGEPAEVSPSFAEPPPFFAPSSSSLVTDSGIEIPPVELPSGRGKKKQVPSGKKGARRKVQKKGKKGVMGEMASTIDETVEDFTRLSQEPSTSATHHSLSCRPPVAWNPAVNCSPSLQSETKTVSGKQTAARKGKARMLDSCEEEDEPILPSKCNTVHTPPADHGDGQTSKENLRPADLRPAKQDPPPKPTVIQHRHSPVKLNSTPMSELIRRVNSQPNSPFPNTSRTYSPILKSSRTMLSRIAPLHPNRRTPPPPLPRPPPPKKSKKQLELEERIEEELAETIEGWSCLTDDERKALRKARIDAELGYEE